MTVRIARAAIVAAIAAAAVLGGTAAASAAPANGETETRDVSVTVPTITPSPRPTVPASVPPPAPVPGPDGEGAPGAAPGGSTDAGGPAGTSGSGNRSGSGGAGGGGAPAADGTGEACVPEEPAMPTAPTSGGGEASVNQDVYTVGETVTATAGGFGGGEQVQLVLFSEPTLVGNFTADPEGSVTAQFPIAQETLAGSHTLQFTGWCGATASVDILVGTTNSGSESDVQGVPAWVWWVGGGFGALLLISGAWWVISAMRAPTEAEAVTA